VVGLIGVTTKSCSTCADDPIITILSLKNAPSGVIGMPKLWIENFVERPGRKRVRRRETNHVAPKIVRHITRVTDLGQARAERD
jgi:hypothetical protein